jgi:hypothetical protein
VLNDGRKFKESYSAAQLIASCHANETLYNILKLEKVGFMATVIDMEENYGSHY